MSKTPKLKLYENAVCYVVDLVVKPRHPVTKDPDIQIFDVPDWIVEFINKLEEKFETWLTNSESEIAGIAGDCAACPVARFLSTHIQSFCTEVIEIHADSSEITIWVEPKSRDDHRDSYIIPVRIISVVFTRFIERLDHLFDNGTSVNKAEVLEVWNKAKQKRVFQ